jgi:hypothetical protein
MLSCRPPKQGCQGPESVLRTVPPVASGPFRPSSSSNRIPSGLAHGVGPRPDSNVCGRPQISSSPAVDRRREVRITAQLVGPLFAHAENLGDLNDSKELPSGHGPQYP